MSTGEGAMTWHVHPEMLADYQEGRLDTVRVMAVEAHMTGCEPCRRGMVVDTRWLDDSWSLVWDAVHAPAPRLAERLLHRCGVPEHRARLLVATPVLRRSWLAACVAVLAFALLAAYLGDQDAGLTWVMLLAIAPVLPVLAVSTAYGVGFDSMQEITATTPTAGPSLVLWRASAVVGASMVAGTAFTLLLPGPAWYAVAWLLPAFLLCVGTLALATAVPLRAAATGLGACWLLLVAATAGATGYAGVTYSLGVQRIFGPTAQLLYLVAALAAVAVLTLRRSRLDPGAPR